MTLSADGSLLGLECLLDGVFGRSSAGTTSSYTGGGGWFFVKLVDLWLQLS